MRLLLRLFLRAASPNPGIRLSSPLFWAMETTPCARRLVGEEQRSCESALCHVLGWTDVCQCKHRRFCHSLHSRPVATTVWKQTLSAWHMVPKCAAVFLVDRTAGTLRAVRTPVTGDLWRLAFLLKTSPLIKTRELANSKKNLVAVWM